MEQYTGQDVPEGTDEEYDGGTTPDIGHVRGKKFWLICAYFVLMALFMVPANKLHLGMIGIVAAMGIAAIILLLIWLLTRHIQRKLSQLHLSKRQWLEMMAGYIPDEHETIESTLVEPHDEIPAPNMTRQLSGTTTAFVLPPATQQSSLPDRIIAENGLYLSDWYMPDISDFLGQIVFLCGIRRTGKSNVLAVIAEEMARYCLPMLIIDTEDEYSALAQRTYLPRGFLAGSPALHRMHPLRNYLAVHAENAFSIGQHILQHKLQVVLNMKSYDTDEEAASILCEIIAGMEAWEAARANTSRIPVYLYLDEAPKWLPEDRSRSVVSKPMQAQLFKTFFGTVVNRGGKQGFGCVFAAQRVQDMNKSALQAPIKFLFSQVQKVDLEQYATFGLEPEDVLTLRQGECYVFTPTVIGFRCFMRKRHSPHLGHTPGLQQLHAHQARPIQTISPEEVTGGEQYQPDGPGTQIPPSIRTTMREQRGVPAVFPTSSRTETGREYQPPASSLEPIPLPQKRPASIEINDITVTPIQAKAYELHTSGHTTIAALAVSLTLDGRFGKVDNNVAYALRNELAALGLIQVASRGKG